MRRAICIFALLAWLLGPGAWRATAQLPSLSRLPTDPGGDSARGAIDGIAARIEDDIITESELHELAAFQQLTDGHSRPRIELIQELADQWIVRGEASATKYPRPSQDDVRRAYEQFVKQFPSITDFQSRCAAAGLDEVGIRRILEQQLYLSRFLDYRFRPAAQVERQQIEAYYHNEFAPQLKARGQPVPPMEDVEDTIREVLVQRALNDLAQKWLDETRERLKIDVVAQGADL
jgi:hypothetical protein